MEGFRPNQWVKHIPLLWAKITWNHLLRSDETKNLDLSINDDETKTLEGLSGNVVIDPNLIAILMGGYEALYLWMLEIPSFLMFFGRTVPTMFNGKRKTWFRWFL